jgi:uncharacterized Fe-S center protein
MTVRELISVDKEKCFNCHACITACSVKYCNDGSGDYVKINSNMCLTCGDCIDDCTNEARYYFDDWKSFYAACVNGEVAPAIASNFFNQYMKINSLLKKIGEILYCTTNLPV